MSARDDGASPDGLGRNARRAALLDHLAALNENLADYGAVPPFRLDAAAALTLDELEQAAAITRRALLALAEEAR